jgi:hypothetical protein
MTALLHAGRPCPFGTTACAIVVGGHAVRWAARSGPSIDAPANARRLAEDLVASVAALPVDVVRVATLLPSGRPVALVGAEAIPVAVSLSHLAGFAAVAASDQVPGVGVDAVDTAMTASTLEWWFDRCERRWSAGTSPQHVWGAKEAAFKAAGIDGHFRPQRVNVRAEGVDGFRWDLVGRWRSACGAGRFVKVGRWLVAVAIRAGSSPAGPAGGRDGCS